MNIVQLKNRIEALSSSKKNKKTLVIFLILQSIFMFQIFLSMFYQLSMFQPSNTCTDKKSTPNLETDVEIKQNLDGAYRKFKESLDNYYRKKKDER